MQSTRRSLFVLVLAAIVVLGGGAIAWTGVRLVSCASAQARRPRSGADAGVPARTTQPAQPVAVPTTLDGADRALAHGDYAAAEQGYTRLARGRDQGRALLGAARAQMETGRYDEAAATAARAARDRAQRVPAETLRGEALVARGRLDEAERVLSGVASDASGFRARVMLGRLLIRRGRSEEAEPHLMSLVQAYNDQTIGQRNGEGLAYVAMAAWALGSVHDANDAFRESTRAAPDRVETQVEWARFFLEKYDAGHAEESLNQAIERNPSHPLARALLARVKLEQSFDFPTANELTDRALRVNPNLVTAHVTRAGMALRDMDIDRADRSIAAALAIDSNDLEALSVKAAIRFLADDEAGFQAAKREVLRRNRRYSRMYSIIAEYADWEHRYPEIVRMAREAVTLDPEDALAHATLGLNLLRMGDEQEGLAELREAWQRDRFNVHVFNTLNLYDDVIGSQYVEFQAQPFVMRMHREERPIMERYAVPMLRRAYQGMVRRYGFTPEGPVRIEMFADVQHFSVRTTGLPNVGVQGVCFGKVVTAISPRGGPFNWGQITWHELAHIFHIQLSRNHVPRWFTEGLAEYETIVARPEWRREEDYTLWTAIQNGRLPPLRDLNTAFTHARSPEDIMVAYYASSQVLVYIVQQFGFPRVVQMLREFGAGRRTPDVVQRVLGLSIDQLDRNFREATRRRLAGHARDFSVDFGRYDDVDALRRAAQAAPTNADAQASLAAGLVRSGDADGAAAAAQRAIGIAPRHPIARYVLARIALARRDARGAAGHLRELIAGGRDGYDVRLLLAQAAMSQHDRAAARRELDAAIRIDRERLEAWQGLAELADETRDRELALRALLEVARIDQHDRESSAKVLALLAERRRWADVVRYGEMALYLDPARAETHRVLAEGYLQTGKAREALTEVDVALLARPERPGPVHLLRARVLAALGRRADAQRAGQQAQRSDPSLAGQVRDLFRGH